jgi:hypothetical protein
VRFAGCCGTVLRGSAQVVWLDAGDVRATATVGLTPGDDRVCGITASLVAETPGISGTDRRGLISGVKRGCACLSVMTGPGVMTVAR